MNDDFDWMNAKADGVVAVPEQAAIAIYENDDGNIVIRQEAQMHIAALEQARLKKQREK